MPVTELTIAPFAALECAGDAKLDTPRRSMLRDDACFSSTAAAGLLAENNTSSSATVEHADLGVAVVLLLKDLPTKRPVANNIVISSAHKTWKTVVAAV